MSKIHIPFKRTWNVLMLNHKTSFNKFKRIEIISSIFSNHNGMKLGMNYRKKNWETQKHMETKQYTTKKAMNQ